MRGTAAPPGRRARARVRRRRCRRPPRRVRTDPASVRRATRSWPRSSARTTTSPADPGAVSGVPQPPAPPRPPGGRRSRRRRSGPGSAPCGGTCSRRSAASTPSATASASIEDIELGTRLAAAGAGSSSIPLLQGTHLKAWSLDGMVETDLWAPRRPVGRAAPPSAAAARRRSTSGWRHRASALASLGGRGVALLRGRLRSDARRAGRARGAEPLVLRAARTAARSARGRDRRLAPRAPPRRRRAVGPGRDRRAPAAGRDG